MHNKIKKSLILSYSCCFFICSSLFPVSASANSGMEFKTKVIDLGKIPMENKEYVRFFEYSNVGKDDIQIMDVRTSCGCVKATWPDVRIKPQESGIITVAITPPLIYGAFEQTLLVYCKEDREELKIRGYICDEQPEEVFKKHIGTIGFASLFFSCGNINNEGYSESVSTIVYNYSNYPVCLDLATSSAKLQYSLSDNPIPPRSTSSLYCSIRDESEAVGIHYYDVSVKVDGVDHGTLLFSAEKKPELKSVTNRWRWLLLPRLILSEDFLIIDDDKHARGMTYLSNIGISTVKILQVDFDETVIQIENIPRKIRPLSKVKLGVILSSEYSPKCKYSKIKIYTDSPKTPELSVYIVIR